LPRPAREYLQEAFERDWIRPRLAAERVALAQVRVDPKARRLSGGDYLR
jgi:hypothetical protein